MKKKTILFILLIWILIGLLLGLDYPNSTSASGWQVISHGVNLLTYVNVFLKYQLATYLLSTILILSAYSLSDSNYAKYILAFELSSWIIRLLFFKEGYIVGFGGKPDEEIVIYDFTSLFLRLISIRLFFEIKPASLANIGFFLLSVFFIFLKIKVFAM